MNKISTAFAQVVNKRPVRVVVGTILVAGGIHSAIVGFENTIKTDADYKKELPELTIEQAHWVNNRVSDGAPFEMIGGAGVVFMGAAPLFGKKKKPDVKPESEPGPGPTPK